jgi:nucleotide-binding universal stress UspA family protein
MTGIVVGVDGSSGSLSALAWAVEEARHREAPVRAVMALELPTEMVPPLGGGWSSAIDWETVRAENRRSLDAAIATVDTTGVDVTAHVVELPAARALLDVSSDADMVVVGSRGRGGFAALLLGSVSLQVAQHATCPVVIVPSAATR